MELRVVGQTLTAKFNGEVLGTATDSAFAEGRLDVAVTSLTESTAPSLIKSLEVLDLDAPAAGASAPPAAQALSSTAVWQPLVPATEWQKPIPGKREFKDGLLHLTRGGIGQPVLSPDGAVRARVVYREGSVPQIQLRATTKGRYIASLYGPEWKGVQLLYFPPVEDARQAASKIAETKVPTPSHAGDRRTLELRAQGNLLTVLVDGVTALEVRDDRLSASGHCGIFSDDGWYESAEYQTLAAAAGGPALSPPAGNATPAAATKDAPFVNGLGMKFVPVPITGGPTGGQRVLFSIWETRVQDYEAFVKDTARPWSRGPAMHGPTDPAVTVRWDDAQAFCGWLTDRERKAGKITAQERYRLPSDHEWSCAVGIGDREDAARGPRSKSYGIPDLFPWGTAWPPPSVVGNYRGEETASSPFGKGLPLLPGYRDDFPEAAPVGSYPANQLGIFDLGGNAKEWCEDRSDESPDKRIVRGGSFAEGPKPSVLSAYRAQEAPDNKGSSNGFRVVLAPVP